MLRVICFAAKQPKNSVTAVVKKCVKKDLTPSLHIQTLIDRLCELGSR